MSSRDLLNELCTDINQAVEWFEDVKRRVRTRGQFLPEILVMKEDKVRVEIRKESGSHNRAHLHITHSDKVDVSLSLPDLDILAGTIDGRLYRRMKAVLMPKMGELQDIWKALNVTEDHVAMQKIIKNLW